MTVDDLRGLERAANPLGAGAGAPAAGSEPLANRRHEAFARRVSGWETGEPATGKAAYMAAWPGCKEASAKSNAARVLARPEVAARVAALRERMAAAADADAAATLAMITRERLALAERCKGNSRTRGLALQAWRDVEATLSGGRAGGQAVAAAVARLDLDEGARAVELALASLAGKG